MQLDTKWYCQLYRAFESLKFKFKHLLNDTNYSTPQTAGFFILNFFASFLHTNTHTYELGLK